MSNLANSEDNATFHQGLHCMLILKQPLGTEIHHDLRNSTCDPFKYTVGSPYLLYQYLAWVQLSIFFNEFLC